MVEEKNTFSPADDFDLPKVADRSLRETECWTRWAFGPIQQGLPYIPPNTECFILQKKNFTNLKKSIVTCGLPSMS